MSTDIEDIIRLDKSHIKPAADMLTRAFQDDPVYLHCLPDEYERLEKMPYLFQILLRYTTRYGETYATSNLEGGAVWVNSNNYPMTFWRLLRSGALRYIFKLRGEGVKRFMHFAEYMETLHKRLAPPNHWYLQALGVDPRFQGQGYAGKLLRTMLAKIDNEGLPCYLEAKERNVTLYEHFGFKVIEKYTIPDSEVDGWTMLREIPS